jgi:hypothetical protein
LGDDDLDGVGGGAIDVAHLWNLLDLVQHVDREAVPKEQDE